MDLKKDILKQNEEAANIVVAYTLAIISALCLFVIFLALISFVKTPMLYVLRDFGIAALLLIVPLVAIRFVDHSASWLKYYNVFSLYLALLIIYSDPQFKYYVFALWVLPLIISAIYINKHLIVLTALFIALGVNNVDYLHGTTIFTPVIFNNGQMEIVQRTDLFADTVFLDMTLGVIIIGFMMLTNRTKNVLTNLLTAHTRIVHQTYYDETTNLPNKSLLLDRIEIGISKAFHDRSKLAVVYVGLGRIDEIENSLGKGAGDQVLNDAKGRLLSVIGGGETLARMQAYELAIFMPVISTEMEVIHLTRRIISAFERPFSFGSQDIYLTSFIGIALSLENLENGETLLSNAHDAMFLAKKKGTSGFEIFDRNMTKKTRDKISMESSLRQVIDANGLTVFYQPKVDIASGKVVGAEALVRWILPDGSIVSPAEFLPLAEETDLIVGIDLQVLYKACAQLIKWINEGFEPIVMSVNVTYKDFDQLDLVDEINKVLLNTKLEPHLLELEITEGIAVQNIDLVIKTLSDVHDIGVKISIDDFGTGYSSLKYLSQFNIDSLKIDQSFIRCVTTIPDDAAIVSMILAMARHLKLKVIAEGVETEEQLRYLKENNCDQVQGFFYSKPIPAEEFAQKFLRKADHKISIASM